MQQQEALNAEAQTQLRRIAPLVRSGSVSAQQIDQQQAQARSSAAALAAARAEQEQARAGVAQAQAQRDKAALLAPADGIVSERHARAGALGGDAPLFKLIRDGLLELDGEVPESALAGILPGMPARVRVPGATDAVAGSVRRVSPKVDEATRMGRVRIALEAAPAIRAGSFAATTLETGQDALPVVVPQRAVTFGRKARPRSWCWTPPAAWPGARSRWAGSMVRWPKSGRDWTRANASWPPRPPSSRKATS